MVQSHPKQQIIHLSLVTVWKLKGGREKGNIRVNKGAKLVAIEKSSDNQATTVTVYKEDGAEIPSSLDGVLS